MIQAPRLRLADRHDVRRIQDDVLAGLIPECEPPRSPLESLAYLLDILDSDLDGFTTGEGDLRKHQPRVPASICP